MGYLNFETDQFIAGGDFNAVHHQTVDRSPPRDKNRSSDLKT